MFKTGYMNKYNQFTQIQNSINKIDIPPREVELGFYSIGVTYNNSINNYISNLFSKVKVKNIKLDISNSYIDFYKNYNYIRIKLLRLKFEKDDSTNQISNIRIITYEGHNTENWEYLKLKDIGILSSFIFKNKLKLIKKMNGFYQKLLKDKHQLKSKVLKAKSKCDLYYNKGYSMLVKKIKSILKTKQLSLVNIISPSNKILGYYPNFIINKDQNVYKNVTFIDLSEKESKLLITTTELNSMGLPIIWEVNYTNLDQYILNYIIGASPLKCWDFLFKENE